jgi:hypothetical protein
MGTAKDVLDGAATIVRKARNYDNFNVTLADHTVMDKGLKRAVVLERLAPFEHGPEGGQLGMMGYYSALHEYAIYVYRKYEEDGDTYTDLVDDVDDIVAEFDKYPTLDNTTGVSLAYISRGLEPEAIMDSATGQGPYFLRQQIVLTVQLQITRVSAE